MQTLQTTEEAEILIREFGWFGPPAIFLGPLHPPKLLDGRKRIEAAKRLGRKMEAPGVVAIGREHAARLLALVGHVDRAVEVLRDFDWQQPVEDLAVQLRVSRALAAEMKHEATGSRRGRPPKVAGDKRVWRQRRMVVERVRSLLRRKTESVEPISREELREALGEWA